MSAAALLGLWAIVEAAGCRGVLLTAVGFALLLVLFAVDIWSSLRR